MTSAVRIIFGDGAGIVRVIIGFLALLSGLVCCVSVGTLIAFVVIGQPDSGLQYFLGFMNLSGSALIPIIRLPLAVINWIVLLVGIPSIVVGSVRQYAEGVKRRARNQQQLEALRRVSRSSARQEGENADETLPKAGNF